MKLLKFADVSTTCFRQDWYRVLPTILDTTSQEPTLPNDIFASRTLPCDHCRLEQAFFFNVHPGNFTWNLKVTQLKRKIIFQTSIFWFQPLIFQGVSSAIWSITWFWPFWGGKGEAHVLWNTTVRLKGIQLTGASRNTSGSMSFKDSMFDD